QELNSKASCSRSANATNPCLERGMVDENRADDAPEGESRAPVRLSHGLDVGGLESADAVLLLRHERGAEVTDRHPLLRHRSGGGRRAAGRLCKRIAVDSRQIT